MEIDRLNKWITLGANIGLILGLIFLIVELKQNSDMMRAQTRHDIVSNMTNMPFNAAMNPEWASLKRRAEYGIGELTPDENFRYRNFAYVQLRYWEDIHYQYRSGLFDDPEYLALKETWRRVLNTYKSFPNYWCERRTEFSTDFASEIDKLLAEENQC